MFTRMLQAYLILLIVALIIVSLGLAIKSGSLFFGLGIFILGMIAICLLGAINVSYDRLSNRIFGILSI